MQPTYLPWLGYFALADEVDTFVFLDDVKYNHRSWQQRNRIKTPKGPMWLTVPVVTAGRSTQLIKEVEIQNEQDWARNHLRSLQLNYQAGDQYSFMESWLQQQYSKQWNHLSRLNQEIIDSIARQLGIATTFISASDLKVSGTKAHRLVNICTTLGATAYVSALGSKEYIEADNPFPGAGIELLYQHYEHPEYQQLHGPFVPYMSIIDLLLNEGAQSMNIVRSGQSGFYRSEEVARLNLGTV